MQNAMNDVITEALKKVKDMAVNQTQRLLSEIQSLADECNAAKVQFNVDMEQAQTLREQATAREAEAVRRMDSTMTGLAAIAQAIVLQLEDGRMVTGSETPKLNGPRLKAVKNS